MLRYSERSVALERQVEPWHPRLIFNIQAADGVLSGSLDSPLGLSCIEVRRYEIVVCENVQFLVSA